MPEDQKNFLFAIALSLLVIVAWELYYSPTPAPNVERKADATSTASAASATSTAGTAGAAGTATTATATAAAQALPWGMGAAGTAGTASKSDKRIAIKTERLAGTLKQKGSVLDDLQLLSYRVSLDENAPPVRLLAPNSFDAVFGWSSFVGEIINDQTPWKVVPAGTGGSSGGLSVGKPIRLTYKHSPTGLSFKREITLDENYMFQIKDEVTNQGTAAQQISPWGQVRRKNHEATSGFYLLHEGLIGFFGEKGLEEIDYDDLEEAGSITINNSKKGWLGFTDKYWAAVLIPNQANGFNGSFHHKKRAEDSIWRVQYIAQPLSLALGQKISHTQSLFAGAKITALVDSYQEELSVERFDLMIDWGWFFFMTKPFFQLLDFFSKLLGNFGAAILVVTVLVKVAFFPLANKSYETMAIMRKVQPELEQIRARHKSDMMGQNREIAELWRKHEVKPLMGCLPMLLQIPVFFALYKVLFVTIEMRHAPFIGWVSDLSAPDPTSLLTLFGLIPLPLPDFLIIGVWPLLMGATMFVQMRLNPPPPDPIQRKVFAWAPVVIMLLLARFPAGLVIYATWNTVLSACQQGVIMKKQGVKIDLFSNLGIKNEPKSK